MRLPISLLALTVGASGLWLTVPEHVETSAIESRPSNGCLSFHFIFENGDLKKSVFAKVGIWRGEQLDALQGDDSLFLHGSRNTLRLVTKKRSRELEVTSRREPFKIFLCKMNRASGTLAASFLSESELAFHMADVCYYDGRPSVFAGRHATCELAEKHAS